MYRITSMSRTVRDDADAPRGLAALVLMYVIIESIITYMSEALARDRFPR